MTRSPSTALGDALFHRLSGVVASETVLAHVPSHHDHKVGEWIGIRPQVDHVVTFERGGGDAAAPMAVLPSRTNSSTRSHSNESLPNLVRS